MHLILEILRYLLSFTQWNLNKMANILGRWHFEMHFFNENMCILIEIWVTFVHQSPVNNKSALVEINKKKCWTGRKVITGTKKNFKMLSAKWLSFCLCHNVLSTKGSFLQYFCNGVSVCLALNHWRGMSYVFFPCKTHIISRSCHRFMNFCVCNVRMQLNKFDAVSSVSYVTLVAITGTAVLVPYLLVMSLKLNWRRGSYELCFRSYLTTWQEYQASIPSNCNMPFWAISLHKSWLA